VNRTEEKEDAVSATERVRAEAELRRVNRALRTLSSCNRALARAATETALLEEICRVIVADGGYRLAWTGYAEDDEQKAVRPVAFAGYEEGYLKHLSVTWADTDRGRGIAGTAIRTGRPAVCQNMLVDPNFAPWRDAALAHGYASSIGLPLVASGRPFGALNIYAIEPDAFDAEEVKLLTELAEDLTYGIMALRTREEHQRSEEALRQEQAMSTNLISTIPDHIYFKDRQSRFVRINNAQAKWIGVRSPGEAVGKTDFDFFSKEHARQAYEDEQRIMSTGDPVIGLVEKETWPDGHVTWMSTTKVPLREADGHITGLVGISRNITEHKLAEEALRASDERFSKAFQLSPLPMAIAGLPDGVFREVNSSFMRFTGYTREEVIGRTSVDLKLWVDERLRQQTWKELAAGNELRELPVVLRASSGALRAALYSAVTIQLGGVDHVFSLVLDITEWKQAEEARTTSQNQLQQILTRPDCMLWRARVTETDGQYRWEFEIPTSGLQKRIFGDEVGVVHEGVSGIKARSLYGDFIVPEQAEMDACGLGALRSGAPGYDQAFRLIKGSQTFWLHERVSITSVQSGQWDLVGITIDLTAQHEAEEARKASEAQLQEEMQRSSRLESVGILAGGIAHDFNNILTAIMGNLTLALLDAEALPKTESYLREAERATLRARDLTQQLLTFAKGGDPVRSAVRLPEIITEAVHFALHGSRAKCEFDLSAGLWLADADKGQLGQVVQNLVINAAQAMPEGGTIRVSAQNEEVGIGSRRPFALGDFVHISVADTGTGIKAEHLAKIFDPYFTTKQHGSGLGLTSVYSIIRKHHGHIKVESELGCGTTFHIWLPALHEQQLDLPEDRLETTKPLKGRVLFMDDEEAIIRMAGLLLKRLGFEVEVARDGSETVRKFAAAHSAGRPFDLVVMDLTVPGGMGGREAIEHLRRIDPGVKAIVSSGYSSDPVLANYRSYGFRGMVAKPFKIEDLTRVFREVLNPPKSAA
jgi:PAS domain S-box-containing protein